MVKLETIDSCTILLYFKPTIMSWKTLLGMWIGLKVYQKPIDFGPHRSKVEMNVLDTMEVLSDGLLDCHKRVIFYIKDMFCLVIASTVHFATEFTQHANSA